MYIIIMDYSNGSLHIRKIDCDMTTLEVSNYLHEEGFNEDEVSYMIVEKLHLNIE